MTQPARIVGLALISAVLLVGCGPDDSSQSRVDDPSQVGTVSTEPKHVIQMPSGQSNISVACDDFGNAVYTNSKGGLYVLKGGCQLPSAPPTPGEQATPTG